ncbi:Maintenance of ploidy protein MOB1 [Candida maltosa Xu316]|uniref:Maintenance of ploidy protein MOB1 n=1 Tax=Candida maltosa (strain Xu316) TaxID=1245528 RepID=M3HRP2_CANMX|nr:Maintenance of ploidy protein MOB1 [Candida maltosa Xu316]
MALFQNFNTHSLRTTRGFKLKQSSPISSPKPISNSVLPQTSALDHTQQQQPHLQPEEQNPYQTINLGGGNGQPVSSHKDIRNYAEQTLGSDNALIQAVKLPRDEDINEWLAIHVVDFYNHINMLYGAITEFCSPVTCPRMIATERTIPAPVPNIGEDHF